MSDLQVVTCQLQFFRAGAGISSMLNFRDADGHFLCVKLFSTCRYSSIYSANLNLARLQFLGFLWFFDVFCYHFKFSIHCSELLHRASQHQVCQCSHGMPGPKSGCPSQKRHGVAAVPRAFHLGQIIEPLVDPLMNGP